jgi:glycosyltransferase involved in cell wall biosynthesis
MLAADCGRANTQSIKFETNPAQGLTLSSKSDAATTDDMPDSLIYDASRLITRTLNAAPNGIDRIDCLLARGILSRPGAHALKFGFGGPTLFPSARFPDPTVALEAVWRETAPALDDLKLLQALTDRLLDAPGASRASLNQFPWRRWRRRAFGPMRSLLTYGPRWGEPPARAAPKGALYVNASHFPIEWPSHVAWLDARPDVRPVQFIHDLLPIERPDLFWTSEPVKHRARLQFLARRGAAALVTSRHVEDALAGHLRQQGRADLPIFRAPPPVAAGFFEPPPRDPRLEEARYFLVCGTIEPRKNHRLLIDVWRRLTRALGRQAPKLVVVGKRGWKCDDILEDMNGADLRSSVIVVSALPTSVYKRLLAHALGLLAPALAEGLGLPIGEALALGAPVIASDIEGHREYPAQSLLLLDPRRPEQWAEAILDGARSRSAVHPARQPVRLRTEESYFSELDRFLQGLP